MNKKKLKQQKAGVLYESVLLDTLKGNEEAQLNYIKASLEDNADMPSAILVALRHVAEARGFKLFAKSADLNRVSLYRTLSKNGNPKLETIYKILDVLGLKLTVVEKSKVG